MGIKSMAGSIKSELTEHFESLLRSVPGRIGSRLRRNYYKRRLKSMGRKVGILPGCILRNVKNIVLGDHVLLGLNSQLYAGTREGDERIEIGDNTALNSHVMLNADQGGEIKIGKDVLIGPNVVLRTSNHSFERRDTLIRLQGHGPGRIVVGDDVWIGANVSILANVTIGKGSVVAAGAVVTKDVSEYSIVGGVPATFIKARK